MEEVLRPCSPPRTRRIRLQAVLLQADTLLKAKRYDEALALLGKEKDPRP